tara:strand:- start:807 stop:1583 length:777 start_codon:yes stop_codon:yes gene_type:complete
VNDPIPPWSPYLGRSDYISSGRKSLTSAFADVVKCRAGFSSAELPEIFAAPADDGENDAARDLVQLDAEHMARAFATGKLETFGRPLGGGEIVKIPTAHWELDDPLPRFATGAFNLELWWDHSAEPTHRIFVDTKQFNRWLVSLQPFGPLTNREVEAIVDPQKRAARAMAREAALDPPGQVKLGEVQDQGSPNPPGVGPVLMTLDEVCDLTRRSSSTIYANMEKGIFPEPIKLGSSSRWVKSEVLAYIAELAAKRGSS